MKTALAFAVVAVACNGPGSRPIDAQGTTGHSITYAFNGSAYSGSLLGSATLMTNTAGGSVLGLQASDDAGHRLAIAVEPATPQTMIAVGTYDTNAAPPLATFQFTDGSDGSWAAAGAIGGSGSITVTTLTATEIKGTFEATMVGSDASQGPGAITNGVFELPVP